LKTRLETERVRKAAEALERVLCDLSAVIRVGITTRDVEHVAVLACKRQGLIPRMRGFGGFPAEICTSVNNVAAHGLPGDRRLEDGDLITVDISAELDGWMADAAWTYTVGSVGNSAKRLVRAAWRASLAGVGAARAGARLGDIGHAVTVEARKSGCSVVGEFTGHGIGRELHEEPVVLHTGESGSGMPVVPGMVLNIEPVLTLGGPEVTLLDDGFSYVTADGSLSAQYEFTVAVRSDRTLALTLGRFGTELPQLNPPYT
jgi:methionyl aminopeptidase